MRHVLSHCALLLAALWLPVGVWAQSWTAPRTWVAGEVVTAAQMNTHVRDNLLVLRGGEVTALTVDTTTLVVDATNNRVGIGTASPTDALHVTNGTAYLDQDTALIIRSTAGTEAGRVLGSAQPDLRIRPGTAGDIELQQDDGTDILVAYDGGNVGIRATGRLVFDDDTDQHSYIVESAANTLQIVAGGSQALLLLTNSVQLEIADTLVFDQNGAGNDYIYAPSDGTVQIFTDGTEALELNSSQHLDIGGSTLSWGDDYQLDNEIQEYTLTSSGGTQSITSYGGIMYVWDATNNSMCAFSLRGSSNDTQVLWEHGDTCDTAAAADKITLRYNGGYELYNGYTAANHTVRIMMVQYE